MLRCPFLTIKMKETNYDNRPLQTKDRTFKLKIHGQCKYVTNYSYLYADSSDQDRTYVQQWIKHQDPYLKYISHTTTRLNGNFYN